MRVEDLLQELIQHFDQGRSTSSRVMRELLEADPDAFVPAALRSLSQTRDSTGYHCLIGLLASKDLLRKCLCDDSLSLSKAVAAARIGMRIDPALARSLMKECMRNGTRRAAETVRMLEILGEIANGERLVPLLMRLLHHPNPRIRSEAALRVGRSGKDVQVWERYKAQTDSRARADAVEGLWGLQEEEARRVLTDATCDPNNRVAGNALVGLRQLGDTGSIGLTLQMAAHSDPLFRATAAWVMGDSADPRFMTVLGPMLADSDNTVRARAFQSVSRIRRRMATQSTGLAVYLWEAKRLDDGFRQLRVSVVDADGGFPAVAATEFLVSEGGKAIVAYDVKRRPVPVTLVVGFAIPREVGVEASPLERALLDCLARKRPGDQWGLVQYTPEHGDGEEQTGDAEALQFTAKGSLLREKIGKAATTSQARGGLLEATRCLLNGAALLPGERHLLLVSSPLDACGLAKEADTIASRARHLGVAIHALVVSGEKAPALEALCGATDGRLLQVETPEQAGAALARMYWGWQYQHEIRYRLEAIEQQSTLPAQAIKIQVFSEFGSGEDALALA